MDISTHSDHIVGVTLQSLSVVSDDRGAVLHMLRADSSLYKQFGEVYFSEVKANVVKAWKRHIYMTQNITVPVGQIKLVIYDGREDSPTHKILQTFTLGRPDHYQLITIPPLVWYGFQCVSQQDALIVNCTDLMHEPGEVERLPDDSAFIPYHWR